MTEIQICC